MSDTLEAEASSSADAAGLMGDAMSLWLEAEASLSAGAADLMGFLNCTKIIVMLSHPSPPAVDGAKHRLSTLSHTVESLLSCMTSSNNLCKYNYIMD